MLCYTTVMINLFVNGFAKYNYIFSSIKKFYFFCCKSIFDIILHLKKITYKIFERIIEVLLLENHEELRFFKIF